MFWRMASPNACSICCIHAVKIAIQRRTREGPCWRFIWCTHKAPAQPLTGLAAFKMLAKRLNTLFLVAMLLSGCATDWHRPGTTKTIMEEDLGRCEQKAAALYPPIMVTVEQSPGYWSPATQQCWRSWRGYTCQQYPATWNPPSYAEQDQNASARRAWVHACMKSLGYRG